MNVSERVNVENVNATFVADCIDCRTIGAVSVVIFLNSIEEKYRLAAEPEPVKMIRVIVPRQNMRADRILEENLAARQILKNLPQRMCYWQKM